MQGRAALLGLGGLERPEQVQARRHVHRDLLAFAPVGRDLQDRRPGKPTVREQHGLVETGLA